MPKTSNKRTTKEKKDPVVEEMISKINIPLIKKLFVLGTFGRASIDNLDESKFMEYIYDWAKNKKWIYQLFGNNFSISKTVKVNKSENEMHQLVLSLAQKFPIYGEHLKKFSINEFVLNKVEKNNSYYAYMDIPCKSGMKLTKFFSTLFQDEIFDIELSKILQNTKLDKTITVSIDPVDFLTMSIHKYKWVSCYDISQGCYSNCAFSIMRDSVSVITFAHNGVDAQYVFTTKDGNFSFNWNSKQLRSVGVIDEETKSFFIFGAQGTADNLFYDSVFDLVKNKILETYPSIEFTRDNESYHVANPFKLREELYSHFYTDRVYSFLTQLVNLNYKIFIQIGVNEKMISPFSSAVIASHKILY